MQIYKDELNFDIDFMLIKQVVVENQFEGKVIPFQTVDKQNYSVVECLSYYENRVNTLLALIDSPTVKEKFMEHTVGFSHKEKIHILSNMFSSPRTRLTARDNVITFLNVGRAIQDKDALLKYDFIRERYGENSDHLFYLVFILESEIMNQIYANTLLDKEAPINSELYKLIAVNTMDYYLEKYGNQPDVCFVVDYFFNRFTYMYAYLGHNLYNKRLELMVSMAKRIGRYNQELIPMHRLQQINN
jgi:hypothetical protein